LHAAEDEMDRLTSMAVFAKVVEANSFSGAARDLGISQATASKHVQMLEGWLGAKLLNRTTRRIGMTEIGESFYAQCTRILEDIDDARSVSRSEVPLHGVLRVAVPVSLGGSRLGRLTQGFIAANPDVSLDLFLSDRHVNPVEDGFDLAIRLSGDGGAGLVVRRLAVVASLLAAAPAYLAAWEAPQHPDDLARHACLHDRQTYPDGWRFAGTGGTATPRLTFRLSSNNAYVLREVALSGGGVLLAPDFVVAADLAAGRLVRVLPEWSALPMEMSVVAPASRQLSPKIRSFAAYLVEEMATG
jgi:DNA-binding transcriptional LysR family regulator